MRKKVLIAVLDWGLGHATRCIPVIYAFQLKNCEVFIASSGSALALLQKEFPLLKTFELESYQVNYSKSSSLVLGVLLQTPKTLKTISKEREQLERIVDEHNIDLVVSDNRYGCWSSKVQSVFICHQLNLQLPFGFGWLQPVVNYFHHRLIKKFSQVWIPDVRGENNLSGELSKSNNLSIKYIGILSRFKKVQAEVKYDIAIILSGPEPQRTILEEIIRKQFHNGNLKAVLVRGVIENEIIWKQDGNLSVVNYLESNHLNEIINQSGLIIARPGYSTIMDLSALGKRAILIPTPGQTEQEYLGRKLMENKIAFCVSQNRFDLDQALKSEVECSGFEVAASNELLTKAIEDL